MTMPFKEVRDALRRSGIKITKEDGNEFRVNYISGNEASAYYTTDLIDALQTGRIMAESRKKAQEQYLAATLKSK